MDDDEGQTWKLPEQKGMLSLWVYLKVPKLGLRWFKSLGPRVGWTLWATRMILFHFGSFRDLHSEFLEHF